MGSHSVIVDKDLNVWVCGKNNCGQLGLGDNFDRNIPTKVENLPKIISASRSGVGTIFLDDQGHVWLSGTICGAKDDGEDIIFKIPRKIRIENISKIASGANHILLLDYEGNVFSLGCNKLGQLGIEGANDSRKPRKIGGVPKIKEIFCGDCHSMLLDFNGNVFAFGKNKFGQLGLGDQENRFIPTKIENLPIIRSISAGFDGSCLADINDNYYLCGNNFDNECNVGTNFASIPTKITWTLETEIKSVHCGTFFVLLIDIDNNLWGVGSNNCGQLGLGHNGTIEIPTRLPLNEEICDVITNFDSTIITTKKGECFGFGINNSGQLGLGHTVNVYVPTKIDTWNFKALTLNNSRFNKTKNAHDCYPQILKI